MPTSRGWLILAAGVILAVGLGLYVFENRGLPADGWQVFLGEGPEPSRPIDGTSGFAASLNVTSNDIDGRPSIHGRYLGSLPTGEYRAAFRTNAPNASVELEIGDAQDVLCPQSRTTSVSGNLSVGRYELDSDPDGCRLSLRLTDELADESDNAPLEWWTDLHHAGGAWWFSFEATVG